MSRRRTRVPICATRRMGDFLFPFLTWLSTRSSGITQESRNFLARMLDSKSPA